VWLPKYVASEITSLNQNDIEQITDTTAKVNENSPELNPCMFKTAEVVSVNIETQVYNGQGEGDTKWKGWA